VGAGGRHHPPYAGLFPDPKLNFPEHPQNTPIYEVGVIRRC
jgi:hypothetical protein